MAKQTLNNNVSFGEQRGKINDNFTELYDDKVDKEDGKGLISETEKSIFSAKQDALVSGTNIKTVNGNDILGSGDIVIGSTTFRGAINLSTPTPTLAGIYQPTVSGTYTNFGGIVVDLTAGFTTISFDGVSGYGKQVNGVASKITTWTATTFASGTQVFHENNIYESNTSTLSTDIPGVSGKWTFKVNPNLVKSYNLIDYVGLAQTGSWSPSGVYASSANTYSLKKFDIAQGTYTLSGVKGISSGAAAIVFFNGTNFDSYIQSFNKTDFTFTVPVNATSIAINLGGLSGVDLNDNPQKEIVMLTKGSRIAPYEPFGYIPRKDYCYLSPTGNDTTGDGTFVNPYKTALRANIKGFYNIKMLEGVYIGVDLVPTAATIISSYKEDVVEIYDNRHEYTAKTLEPTYTNVYKLSGTYNNTASTYQIWIDGLPDAQTLINIADRLPIHKGRTHRLMSTKIKKGTSLADLEASLVPLWFNVGTDLFVSNIGTIDLSINKIVVPNTIGMSNLIIEYNNIILKYSTLMASSTLGLNFLNSTLLYSANSGIENYSSLGKQSKIINSEIGGGHNNGCGYGSLAICEETNIWVHDFDDEGSSAHDRSKVKRKDSYYTNNASGITDVGSCEVLIDNCVVIKNSSSSIIFSFSASSGENIGNALIVNSTVNQNVTANISGRVTSMNSRIAGTTANITII